MRKVPLLSPLLDERGMITKEWAQFFMLLAKDVAGWQPPSLADADAANNTVYYSTTASKLVYKNSAGVVNNLY